VSKKAKSIRMYISRINKIAFQLFIFLAIFDLTLIYSRNSVGQMIALFGFVIVEPSIFRFRLRFILTNLICGLLFYFALCAYHGNFFGSYLFVHLKIILISINTVLILNWLLKQKMSSQWCTRFIVLVFSVQLFFAVFSSLAPVRTIRNIFIAERSSHIGQNFGDSFRFRDAFLSNLGFSGYAIGCIPFVVLFILLYFNKTKTVGRKVVNIGLVLSFLNGIIAGRSVIVSIPIAILVLVVWRPKDFFQILKIIPILILFIGLCFAAVQILDIPKSWILFFVEDNDTVTGLDSLDDLLFSHTYIAGDFKLLGYGEYMTDDGSFMESDIGYYRQYGVGGIPLIALYLFIIYNSFRSVLPTRISQVCLVIVCMCNFKQEVFNNALLIGGLAITGYSWTKIFKPNEMTPSSK
jgi:hypothetical protein